MPSRIRQVELDKSAGPIRRVLHYAFYDWTREMPRSRRIITWVGYLMQGYAIYALWVRSLVWPVMWAKGILFYALVALL